MNINSRHILRFFKRYLKTIVALIIVFGLSFMPQPELDEKPSFIIPHFDKIAHFGMYFIFTLVMVLDISKYQNFSRKKVFLYSSVISFTIGGLIELGQSCLTADRSGNILDLLADTLGILAALLFVIVAVRVKFLRRVL